MAVDTQTAVSQHQMDNQPHLQPLEIWPVLREQPRVADRKIFTRFAHLVPIDHHARCGFLPNGLLQVQVCLIVCLILCRIIIHQVEVGPRLLNHPNLLPPEVLDCALH